LPRLSPYALAGVALLHVGGVSSGLIRVGPKATRQLASPRLYRVKLCNKGFGRLMVKRVILVTGTPCVGKTSVARLLAEKLNALYVNLTELALKENLVLGKDEKRGSVIIDEKSMKRAVGKLIEDCGEQGVVVDGHYAASVVPKRFVTHVFVLRRDPVELRGFMERAGFLGNKLWENLAAEILDVCLVDALKAYGSERVCEIDVSKKSVENVVAEILEVLSGSRKCYVGIVDWLGKLEQEGLLEEFLKI
jgi:adenylate kinase